MHQMKPELQNYLVESLLNDTFKETPRERKEYADLVKICQNFSLESMNVKKTLLRLMRMEANRMLIRAFVASLQPEKQMFLRMKYKGERELINISMNLHVSVSQLSIWSKNLIQMAGTYINYELTPKDIFLRKKIINMLEILAMNLKFVELVDPEREVVDEYWLSSVEYRYNNYRKLLNALNEVMVNHNIDMQSRVVSLQLKDPYASKSVLSEHCKLDKGTVSRYLMSFRDDLRKYIVFSQPLPSLETDMAESS